MHRLSIARSLRVTLVALTLGLGVLAAIGVASLYQARQSYENTLASSSALATAAANLLASGAVEEEALRAPPGAEGHTARRVAAADYASVGATTARLAASDPISERLVDAQISAENQARALAARGSLATAAATNGPLASARLLASQLQARQQERQQGARATARSASRRDVLLVAVAAVLALAGAIAVITLLVSSMRGPLDALVTATRRLAAGDLGEPVVPSGPRELRDLGAAFNAMSADLATAQQRLEDERQRLAATIESLGDALIVTESDARTIAVVNPRVHELLPGLIPGGRVDAEPSPLPPLPTALAGETTVEHGGRTLAVTAATLGEESHAVVWTVRDMSERARLERAKSEFVATASHELRSPLTSIKGFVELLERSPDLTGRQREFVDIIMRSTDRLVDLVNDLLDVARIEADRVELNRRAIDVGEAVHEVAELMGPRVADKHQRLDLHVAPMLPAALADASRVRQIVANLLTNAHLYSGDGGTIDVSVRANHTWVEIVVADNGPGMSRDEVGRVFERFYRGGDDGTRTPGTGLGLSIVKSLVDLQGGEIELESEPGRGTTFRIRLPCAEGVSDVARSISAMRGRRVLVVDDERDIADLIAGQLDALDVRTEIVTSGEAALARLREEHFDAVTLDILMPGLDGFGVLRAIRADARLRHIPIVFVSVFSGRRELAGEFVVGKPIDADELREVLGAAVLAGRSRVLVVGREEMRGALEPAMRELGIEHYWETSGPAAARVCSERRFEVALVDAGIRSPQAVLQALDLRGRRVRQAVILFSDGSGPTPNGIEQLGIEVVPVGEAANALLAALRGGG
ncbi:MAG TPA: ATP-binding protein [Solirubrobacteraceae bacterium]|jgi:signal transduction histidine kinase/DNA-binding NarL/FixJ family response regulator|nr:ATP-binding protein [Solirubrobacteraceae bacterium]